MKYKLSAKDKVTKKDVTLDYFNDEIMFDTKLDDVDYTKYESAMILDISGTFPVCVRYKEFNDNIYYYKILKKIK